MKNRDWSKNTLFIDRDGDWSLFIDPTSPEAARKAMTDAFSIWGAKGGHATDVAFCVYEQNSVIPSGVTTWMGGKYPLKEDHGHPCDYDHLFGRYSLEGIYKAYTEFGIDPVRVYVDCMKRAGIRPWLAMRMNDAHYLYEDDVTFCKAELFYEELAAGHMIGDQYGYFGRCFDFTYPKIRLLLLNYIRELMGKYRDVFGLSLDFLREPFCFDYKNHPDCHGIMTEFIRGVRSVLDDVKGANEEPFKLMVRLPHTPAESLAYGFDAATWCREGLVDAIEPCARWECVNSGIPVREWRECVGEGVALIPGVESRSLCGCAVKDGTADRTQTIASLTQIEQVRAYHAAWKACGADGLYLANMCYDTPLYRKMWTLDPADPEKGLRRFIVTYQDIPSGMVPDPYRPLPINLAEAGELVLEIGRVEKGNNVRVLIDYEGGDHPVLKADGRETVEGAPCGPVICPAGDQDVLLTPHTPLAFALRPFETDSRISLDFSGEGVIHYVEVDIS